MFHAAIAPSTAAIKAARDAPSPARTPKEAAHEQDAKLRLEGALAGIAGRPVHVRNPETAHLETRDGPFMKSALPIAGLAVMEAADLAEAIEKVSRVRCAVAHGVVEIRPLELSG